MTSEGNGTQVPTWETKFAEIEQFVDRLATQRDVALKKLQNTEQLLELTRRELELALMKIEELITEADEEAEQIEARDG